VGLYVIELKAPPDRPTVDTAPLEAPIWGWADPEYENDTGPTVDVFCELLATVDVPPPQPATISATGDRVANNNLLTMLHFINRSVKTEYGITNLKVRG
jgi:hypothetical protein